MDDLEVPEGLVELRCRWLDADAASSAYERALPSGADIVAGRAEITDDQRARSKQLRTEVVELTEAILFARPWLKQEFFTRRPGAARSRRPPPRDSDTTTDTASDAVSADR